MKKYIAPFFFVAVIGNVQAAEITETHVTGTRFKFTAKLDAPLIAGNKVKIDFGKNLVLMTCAETTCTLFRTMNSDVMPAYKIGIYNSKNVLQVAETHTATKSYTKIANDGSELLDSAQLGTNPKDWACTKDNKTGLIWEVKTTDGGLRDANKKYTNFTVDYPECDWYGCAKDNPGKYGDVTNTDGYIETVNRQKLCGANDWQLPTREELEGLRHCSDDLYNADGSCTNYRTIVIPLISAIYFPNTLATNYPNHPYWSSSIGSISSMASVVHFHNFSPSVGARYDKWLVRLVRNAQ
jgi:hypothetical protein